MPPDQELEATQELVIDLLHHERSRDPDVELTATEIARRCCVRESAVVDVLRQLRRRGAANVQEGESGWTVAA